MSKFFIFICFFFISIYTNTAQNSKIDAQLIERFEKEKNADFLIILKEQAEIATFANNLSSKDEKGSFVFQQLQLTAKRTQSRIIQFLKKENINFKSFYIVNALYIKGNLLLASTLAGFEEVAQIQNNPTLKNDLPSIANTTSLSNDIDDNTLNIISRGSQAEWGIRKIKADSVWLMGYKGQGVVIGGQDTGYDWQHPALKDAYRGWNGTKVDHNYNWHDAIHSYSPINSDTINICGLNKKEPCDDDIHGTHTMGTMLGNDNSGTAIGVAPAARWVGARNMDRGAGSPATYIECFEFMLAPTDLNGKNPDPKKAPHVINNSWGCPLTEGCNANNWAVMKKVIENVRSAGIVVVVSAGNAGRKGCASILDAPAFFDNVFSVGATNDIDSIASFSSKGPIMNDLNKIKPDISAPGVNVRSSFPNGGYGLLSGTSMAGPHVVGLVALMISANPSIAGQVDIIEQIIKNTAKPLTNYTLCGNSKLNQTPNDIFGYGRIDALQAVKKALHYSKEAKIATLFTYPNPVQNNLHIEFWNWTGNATFNVFDITGRLVKQYLLSPSANFDEELIDLNDLARGFYIYESNGIVGKIWKN